MDQNFLNAVKLTIIIGSEFFQDFKLKLTYSSYSKKKKVIQVKYLCTLNQQ